MRAAKAALGVVDVAVAVADAGDAAAAGGDDTVDVVAAAAGAVDQAVGVAEGTAARAADNVAAAGAAVYNSVASRCPWKPRLAYTDL